MTPELTDYPELNEPYAKALREAVEWIFASYEVCGLLVTGTILRGTPDTRSDLDIHVLHRDRFRERVQRFFNGVPCEIFVNPPDRVKDYFIEDLEDRRPISPHMYATGTSLFDPDGQILELQTEATSLLTNTPQAPCADALTASRYSVATEFEDVLDLAERDEHAASVMLGAVIVHLLEFRANQSPGWKPRNKDLLQRIEELDPLAARLAIEAASGFTLYERLEATRSLCALVTQSEGFFEWKSPREVIPPAK